MKRHLAVGAAALLGLSLAAGGAAAEPRTHDGFFMRLGLNIGPGSTTVTSEVNGVEAPGELKIKGLQPGVDLMFGGTPVPGLVLGGSLLTAWSSKPSIEAGPIKGDADGTLIVAGLMFFGNYYFDPTQGLHAQALLGYGALDSVSSSGQSGGNDPFGPMLGLGVGYDFWISDELSVGPFGRIVYGAFSVEEGAIKNSYSHLYPSIGAAFTLH